ncbi:hypothetical protein SRHO_G00251560 [Serrasalmus rhombeus]
MLFEPLVKTPALLASFCFILQLQSLSRTGSPEVEKEQGDEDRSLQRYHRGHRGGSNCTEDYIHGAEGKT